MADAAVTAAVTVAVYLVEKVGSILEKEANLEQNVEDGTQHIRNLLRTIKAYLTDHVSAESDHAALHRDRANQLRDIAYDIEDVVDEFLLTHVPHHYHRHEIFKHFHSVAHFYPHRKALRRLSSQIDDILKKIKSLLEFDPCLPSHQSRQGRGQGQGATSSSAPSTRTSTVEDHDEIVGFEKPKEQLIRILMLPLGEEEGAAAAKRTIISVVGPAGSGKSLLVNSVYRDQRVVARYDCRAWVVSPNSFQHDEEAFFRRLLTKFSGRKRRPDLHDEHLELEDVRDKLKSLLQRRRYLLVLDDVWSKEDCEAICRALPPGSHGSTVIITTTNSNVVVINSATHHHHVHKMQGLSPQHAWELFCNKAFPHREGYCPKELMEISQSIVTKCEGLPSAIVDVGSLLATKEQTPVEFRDLLDCLGSEIEPGSNLSNIGKKFLRSYNHLSCNVKSCLLYFSMLPEDHTIRRQRLIRLWMAEGFIKEKRGKTVEKVADEYLNELARDLVEVISRDVTGRVTACRVSNLVREFLIHKSQEENFATILDYADANGPRNKINARVRRLSIHYAWSQQYKEILDLGHVRTLSMFGIRNNIHSLSSESRLLKLIMLGNKCDHSFSSGIEKFLGQFRLLKVLDLEGAPLDTFPEQIVKLALLTYLSLKETKIKTIPESIKKLAYLQTLNLKQTDVTELPPGLFAIKSLRHLLVHRYNVKNYVTFDSVQGAKFPRGIKDLVELQKLSLVRLNSNEGIIEELGALTQLRKLWLRDLKREDGGKLCAAITKMPDLLCLEVSSTMQEEYLFLDDLSCPRFLQRLCLKGRLLKLPPWFSSPALNSLVKIHLKWSRLKVEANPLGALGALPNLLELEMVDAYMGTKLEFKSNLFKKLKVLYLEQLVGLNTLVMERKAMATLEKLTICKCDKLEILPLGIEYLTHLQELILYDMNRRFLSRLARGSADRYMVDHISTIQSFKLDETTQGWSAPESW